MALPDEYDVHWTEFSQGVSIFLSLKLVVAGDRVARPLKLDENVLRVEMTE